MPGNIIECKQLTKCYQNAGDEIKVLDDVNFSVLRGESVSIMGASGSGKSTLLNVLGGLDKASSGEVILQGKSLAQLNDSELSALRNKQLGFVYQMHHLLMEFSALENVAMPLLIQGCKKSSAYQSAQKILEKVGLSHRLNHKPFQLSGGERQRVAIARALVANPSCVLMDEPTGNLDKKTADGVLALISDLQHALNISFLVVTHDLALAKKIGAIFELNEGRLRQKD